MECHVPFSAFVQMCAITWDKLHTYVKRPELRFRDVAKHEELWGMIAYMEAARLINDHPDWKACESTLEMNSSSGRMFWRYTTTGGTIFCLDQRRIPVVDTDEELRAESLAPWCQITIPNERIGGRAHTALDFFIGVKGARYRPELDLETIGQTSLLGSHVIQNGSYDHAYALLQGEKPRREWTQRDKLIIAKHHEHIRSVCGVEVPET